MEPFNGTLTRLPKTTEEATRRYLYHYEKNFCGAAAEQVRLKATAEAYIYQLRKVAPRFYEEKLPTLINQAASALLTCNTNTSDGIDKFNETHAFFLRILSDLRKSQPAGEVNFQDEKKRMAEWRDLCNRQLVLLRRISELEGAELEIDDLGDDEDEVDNYYNKVWKELDELKAEEKTVAYKIAYIEGEQIEVEAKFELRVPPNTALARLTQDQLKNLERQMLDFYKENNKKITALYVDKSIIDGMIEKLKIDQSQFKNKEEIRELSKNALDAYRGYYRELAVKDRNKYHEFLLTSKSLLPKEGEIISGPDDVPEHVKQKLDQTDQLFQRRREDLFEEFSRRPVEEDDYVDEEVDDAPVDDTVEILETIKRTTTLYARVKEEPRDDYVEMENASDYELIVSKEVADEMIDGKRFKGIDSDEHPDLMIGSNGTTDRYKESDSAIMSDSDGGHIKSETNGTCIKGESNGDHVKMEEDTNCDDDDDDDCEIECLGIVEPTDKVEKVVIE